METQSPPDPEKQELTEQIARQLGEKYPFPLRCISRTIEFCGEAFTLEILEETMKIEAEGGMQLPNKRRRRTPGGVFFYLIRQRIDEELEQKIFNPDEHPYWRPPGNSRVLPKGEARYVELTIKGRPGKVVKQEEVVIVNLRHPMKKVPNLPLGVPKPEQKPTEYKIYIAMKQWVIVEEFLHVPEDELIVQGIWGHDPDGDGFALFAITTTTRQREWMLRRMNEEESEDKPKANRGKRSRNKQPGTEREQASKPVHQKSDVEKKLEELRSAADVFKQKIAALEAKPSDQQSGLQMTRRLLQNTEAQIKALEAQSASSLDDNSDT